MTPRPLLLLFPLFLACLPACGDGSGSADGAAAPGSTGAGSSTSGGKSTHDNGAGANSGPSGAAGARSVGSSAGTANSYAPPPIAWNSAKSAAITDDQLEAEYVAWQVAHVEVCANGTSVVVGSDGKVASEGIAYGMLLASAMGDQALFDSFHRYYQGHLDSKGLMNWKTDKCDPVANNNANSATDADLDVAMSLVQAAALWPAGGYLAQAQAQTSKIIQLETDLCDGRRVLRPGDSFGGCTDPTDQRINPSYFSPGYYKVFAHYFPEQASTWGALGDGSYQLYAIYQARMTSLVPDWSGPDGSDRGYTYWYDACRTPWRVAVDYAWTGDSRAKTFMQNVSAWVDRSGGLPAAAQQQNSAFVGAFALAGGYEQGKFDGYVSSWLSAEVDDAPYLQGTLRVLYLLVAAGKFSSTL